MTRRILAVAAAVLALGLVTAGPALAHPGDPTLVTVLRDVDLPEGVDARILTTIGDQLVVSNPTPTPLAVLDADGAEFLRISAAGVQGNAASPYFHLTAAPQEVRVPVPAYSVPGAPARWVPLAAEPTWAWFDPRLSPQVLQVPVGGRQDVSSTEELASFTVPLRYGAGAVELAGALVKRPVTGRFETTLDPAPAGLSAVLGQGYVPTLSLQAAPGLDVTVLGRDGAPYLRFGAAGVEVQRSSPTYRDDLLGRGRPVTADEAGWVGLPGTSSTWLDTRLRFPAEDPPESAAGASEPVDIARWEIPVIVDGAPQALTGAIRWLPNGRGAADSPWTAVAIAGGVVLLLVGGAVLVLRTRRLAAQAEPQEEESHDVHPVGR